MSFSSPSQLTFPLRLRRKSSSASTTASIDDYTYNFGDTASSSSPLLSSSPPLTPLPLALPHARTRWKAEDHSDDIDRTTDIQRGKVDASHSWSCRTRSGDPISYMHCPPLMAKFAARTPWSGTSLSYRPLSNSSISRTAYLYPQGDSAISDDCEEYDLESMNIHIHETYFAISAERGRWLSSPIASHAQPHAVSSIRGHSSPIKTLADASSPREHSRRHARSCSVDPILVSSSKEHNENTHCSFSLPPSSPPTSPLSTLSALDDDCDPVIDPFSNSDNRCTSGGTPESSISDACPSTPLRAPVIVATHFSRRSTTSCHPSPYRSLSPKSIDTNIHVASTSRRDSDDILSPLSLFELDLPEAEPPKPPLMDMENKLYPGQRTPGPGITVDPARSHDAPSSVQFLSMDSNRKPPGVSLDTFGETSSEIKGKKRRKSSTDNLGARQTKKRAAIRSGNPPSVAKKGKEVENHTFNHSELPRKRSSRYRDEFATCRANSRSRCSGVPKGKRLWQSPSRAAAGRRDSEPVNADKKISKFAASPRPSDPADAVDAEFHASLTGMLVEALATSRATSMDSAALYLVIMQAHPYLAATRSKQELLMDIAAVLEAGRVRCGMFEKVDSSCEGSRHKMLESRWFYVAEQDEDEERASLMSAIMPRQKRNETKKYKQYYYQPLDKISRWDPEDAS